MTATEESRSAEKALGRSPGIGKRSASSGGELKMGIGVSHEALASGSLSFPESGSMKLSTPRGTRQRATSTFGSLISADKTLSEGLDEVRNAVKDFVQAPTASK